MATETATDKPDTSADAPVEAAVDIEGALEKAYQTQTSAEPGKDEGKVDETAKTAGETVDWSKFNYDNAPQEVKESLFKQFSPKVQERIDRLQQEKEQIYKNALDALSTKGVQTGPDLQAQLKEAIDAGDLGKVVELQQAQIQQEIGAVKGELTQRKALEIAVAQDPTIMQNQTEIGQRIMATPELQAMAKDPKLVPLLLRGVNAQVEREKAETARRTLETNFKAAVAAAVQEDRKKRTATVNRLGESATAAGKSQSPKREAKQFKGIDDSLEAAWESVFG